MARVIGDELVESVAGALSGAIDTGDGGTDEQRAVLAAIVGSYWERPDLDLDVLAPLDPTAAAGAISGAAERRRVRELLVLLAICRHPVSEAQQDRIEEYAAALDESGPGIELTAALVREGLDAARADFNRFLGTIGSSSPEPQLADRYTATLDAPDPGLAERLRALHGLPEGSLGWSYVEFYRRNGIELPGDNPFIPAQMVAHDFTHVIGGYEPTAPGEIALGAMLLSIDDHDDRHWIGFLANLGVHEGGYAGADGGLVPKTATLARPGAVEMLAEGFARGAQCTADFTNVDHLALASLPLEEVRARFGVPPHTVLQV